MADSLNRQRTKRVSVRFSLLSLSYLQNAGRVKPLAGAMPALRLCQRLADSERRTEQMNVIQIAGVVFIAVSFLHPIINLLACIAGIASH